MITSKRDLDALPMPSDFPLAAPRRARTGRKRLARPGPVELVLPAPADRVAYTLREVAEVCGVEVKTVANWMSSGKRLHGAVFRLATLNVPRRHVAPGALAQFLGTVNGLRVRVAG